MVSGGTPAPQTPGAYWSAESRIAAASRTPRTPRRGFGTCGTAALDERNPRIPAASPGLATPRNPARLRFLRPFLRTTTLHLHTTHTTPKIPHTGAHHNNPNNNPRINRTPSTRSLTINTSHDNKLQYKNIYPHTTKRRRGGEGRATPSPPLLFTLNQAAHPTNRHELKSPGQPPPSPTTPHQKTPTQAPDATTPHPPHSA